MAPFLYLWKIKFICGELNSILHLDSMPITIYFSIILHLLFHPFCWADILPSGISLIAIKPEKSSLVSELFGESYQELNAAYQLDSSRSRWRVHKPQLNSGDRSIETFDSLTEITPLFVDLQSPQEIPLADLDSTIPYQVVTGWVLNPVHRGETLTTLIQAAGMQRLFAVFGLEGGVWYGKVLKNVGVVGEIFTNLLATESVRELVELSSGRAYWFGYLPQGQRIGLHSTRIDGLSGSKVMIKFGEALNDDYVPAQGSPFLGSQNEDEVGSWYGDIYVSDSASKIYSRLDPVSVDGDGFEGPLLSVIDLTARTAPFEIDRLVFSRYSTLLALESSFRKDTNLSELELEFLGPVISIDGEDEPPPLSQAAFSRISTALIDPSFEGVSEPSIEITPGAMIHQLANYLLEDPSLSAVDFVSTQGKRIQSLGSLELLRKQVYSRMNGASWVSMLFNEISINTGLSWIPTPQLMETSPGIPVLNRFYLGALEAKAISIMNQTLVLGSKSSEDFIFQGVPDALKLSLGLLGDPLDLSFDLHVRIESALDPDNHYAQVFLSGFRLRTLSDYTIEALFPQDQGFEFSFRVPTNNIVAASGSSKNNTLDKNDFRIGQTGRIEIPISSYLSKADGQFGLNLEEDFEMPLNLILDFQGALFLLQGSSGYQFSKIKIPNVQLNN